MASGWGRGNYLMKRRGVFYFFRRVPAHLRDYDTREAVRISLKTADPIEAARRAAAHNAAVEAFWADAVKSGRKADDRTAAASWRAAVAMARAHGFFYRTADELAAGPLQDLAARLRALEGREDNAPLAAALLGGVDRPPVLISEVAEKFWPLAADRLSGKTPVQVSKWKTARAAALKNLIGVIGDKPLDRIARADVLAFRGWWMERVAGGYSGDSANKQIKRVRDMIRTVAAAEEIAFDDVSLFRDTGVRIVLRSRAPFEAAFVQERLLSPGALAGMGAAGWFVIFMAADTGARPGEIIGLRAEDIFIDDPIPYIWIRPRAGSTLKTAQSERKIPLAGAALAAARAMPGGVAARWNHRDSASNMMNKYLRENGLLPSDRHSVYSLRHTFKDRLRDAGAPGEVIDNLMGHKGAGPHYGRGHTLETKAEWLRRIAFRAEWVESPSR